MNAPLTYSERRRRRRYSHWSDRDVLVPFSTLFFLALGHVALGLIIGMAI